MIKKINFLVKKIKELRKDIIKASIENGGHVSTSFSCIEILVGLYYSNIFKLNRKNFRKNYRDYFILSKGHAETGLYSVLADLKFFPKKKFFNSYKKGSFFLGGHASHKVPGVELSTGSLGHGLSYASGIALAGKKNKKNYKVITLMGDGECTEGSIWEAALFAANHKLSNLLAIIDKNNMTVLDFLSKYNKIDPLDKKWKAFGWKVIVIDGHNISSILRELNKFKNTKTTKPTVIIANTIKGKGVSFMENDPQWHTRKLDDESLIKIAYEELK